MDELVLMAVDYNIMDQDDASTHSSLPELLDPDNWVSDSSDDETLVTPPTHSRCAREFALLQCNSEEKK